MANFHVAPCYLFFLKHPGFDRFSQFLSSAALVPGEILLDEDLRVLEHVLLHPQDIELRLPVAELNQTSRQGPGGYGVL